MSALGSLVVKLALEHAQFTKGLDKSSQEALKFAKNTQSSFDKASKATSNYVSNAVKGALAVGAAYLSVNSIIDSLNESINNLADLDDFAQQTGSSVENLSRLQKIAKQFNGDFGLVNTTLNKFAKNLAGIDDESNKVNKALRELGITQDFVKNNDPSEVFVEVAKRLQKYEDGANKAALVNDALGKSAVDLLPYMNDVAENIDNITGASAKSAAEAAAFQDNLGKLRGEFDEYYQQLTTDMLPAMNDVLGVFVDSLKASQDLGADKSALNWADEMALAGARVFDTFNNLWMLLKAVGGSFKSVFADIQFLGEAGSALTPGSLAAKLARGENPLGDMSARLKDRNKSSGDADKAWVDLLNADRSKYENALLAKFAARKGNASPYQSPNTGKDPLDYRGAEAEAAIQAKLDAENKLRSAARDKDNADALEDIQAQIDFEMDMTEAAYQYEQKLADEKYKADTERMEKLQEIANDNYKALQEANEKAETEKRREFEKTMDGIDETFREGFTGLLNGGEGSWKSFTTSLRTTFKTSVADQIYKMFAQPFVVKMVASLLGVSASGSASAAGGLINNIVGGDGGVAASGGGMGGLGDLFSMGKSLFGNGGFQGALVGSIENLGTIFSNGMGGLGDSIGGFLGANAGMIADVLPFAGAALQLLQGNTKGAAFTAIGAAVGSFIPVIGTALGGLIGSFVGSLFGGKDYKRFGTTVSGVKVGQEEYAKTGEGKIYDRKIAGIADPLNNLNEAFSNTLSTLFKSFDIESTIGTTSGMFQRGKSKKSGGIFGASVDGVGIGEMKVQLKKASMEQVYNALVDMVMGEGLVRAIQASKLSVSIKSLFDGFTDKTQVTALIQATMSLNGAQAELASRFGITVDQSAQAAKSTGLAGQALIDYVNKLTSSAMVFATIGDQLIKARTGLEDAYGGSLPDTLKAYDEAIKSVDKTTQEGIDTFVELFGMRDQFAQFRQAIDGLKGNVRGALYSMVSDAEKQQMLNEDLAKLFGDLGRDVPGSIQELIALGKSIDYTTAEGLNLAAVFPSLVQAFNQTESAVQSLMDTMRDSSKFASSFEFNRYTGIAGNYGTSFANNYVDNMASYDVGTSYVPKDGVAMIHKGEAILTSNQNASITQDSANMVAELRALRLDNQNMRIELQSIAISSVKTEKSLDRLQKDGFIIRDVDANGDPQVLQVEVV
jgi:hypothetical protein